MPTFSLPKKSSSFWAWCWRQTLPSPCKGVRKRRFLFWKVTSYSPRSRSRVRACLTCMFEVCIWTTNIYRGEHIIQTDILLNNNNRRNDKSPLHPPFLESTSCPSPPWPSPSSARPAAAPCSHWTSPQVPRAGPSIVPASPPEGHSESFIGWREFSVETVQMIILLSLLQD